MEYLCTCAHAAPFDPIVLLIAAGLGLVFLSAFVAAVWLHFRQARRMPRKAHMREMKRQARRAMDHASDVFVREAEDLRNSESGR
jgi:hypothetical protein